MRTLDDLMQRISTNPAYACTIEELGMLTGYGERKVRQIAKLRSGPFRMSRCSLNDFAQWLNLCGPVFEEMAGGSQGQESFE
jgi:hypothetical protein